MTHQHGGFYFSGSQAQEALQERTALRERVERFWDESGFGCPPIPAMHQEMAIFARHVATARYEDVVFSLMAQQAGLKPVWLEYTADQFVTCSPFKLSLVRGHYCSGKGRNAGLKTVPHQCMRQAAGKAFDSNFRPERWNGVPLCDIVVPYEGGQQRLVDIHHSYQDLILGNPTRFDMSPWLTSIGDARAYYRYFLTLFVAHAVLFEDYHGGESGGQLSTFTDDVFEPAWREVCEMFGVAPIIVPMPWWSELSHYPVDDQWHAHQVIPDHYLQHMQAG